MHVDVAIVGGGPAGATCGTLLKKYAPRLHVAIFEREAFPRDHVGESQLPVISKVLYEMEVWDKVERAGFPIKIGATYRWGRTRDLWDFNFVAHGKLKPEARPAAFEGQRRETAFQVDRAIYDQILLNHAAEFGCEVHTETAVRHVEREGDSVTALVLDSGERVTANHYVDASGHFGLIRRAMGVETTAPTSLQNIAIWDYWQNAEWAVSIGVGGTRVQVLSLGYGWIWFIPLGPTRTSIGLIVPAAYYKASGKRPADLYQEALQSDPIVRRLIASATSEDKLSTTKDWSFLADRLTGANWFLAGESAGFADPILAAGMTLAHMGARDVAYTILALQRAEFDEKWLRERYDQSQRRQIRQHIRFADFWYTHNGVFTDLKDFTRELAGDHGLDLTADEAWRWFGQGGFIDHDTGGANFAGYSLLAAKKIASDFTGEGVHLEIDGKSTFAIHLDGATKTFGAVLRDGRITRHRVYERQGKLLPNLGVHGWLLTVLREPRTYREISHWFQASMAAQGWTAAQLFEAMEAMIGDGWIVASTVPGELAVETGLIDQSAAIGPSDLR